MPLWRQAKSNWIVLGWNFAAGWSSSVARRAHNPEVVGSNPASATNSEKVPTKVGAFSFAVDNLFPVLTNFVCSLHAVTGFNCPRLI